MGHVKRDLGKQAIKNDTTYPYTEAGIERLLTDIYKLPHEESYGGNYDTVVLRVDLERALQSQALSPRQRIAIGLYFFAQLTQEECARVLGVSQQALDDRLSTATVNLSEHMSGYNIESSQSVFNYEETSYGGNLNMWITNVLYNSPLWWNVPDDALRDLNSYLGIPDEHDAIDDDGEEYPILTDGQLRARNRNREILRPEIYPAPSVGTMRSSDDGHKIRLHKQM